MSLSKTMKVLGASAVCSLVVMMACGFTSEAKEETTMAATTHLNVRQQPGTNSKIIGSLKPGEAVAVRGISDGWYHILYNGKTAYVSQDYLNFEGSSKDGDVPNGKETDMKATVSVNIRSGAGMNYGVIGCLYEGKKIQVIGKTGGWYKVKFKSDSGEMNGYIYGKYLNFLDPDTENATDAKKEDSNADTSADGKVQKMTVNAKSGLNVRQKPSTKSKIIGALKQGTVVEVSAADGDWWEVEYKGKTGYIHQNFVSDGILSYEEEGDKMVTTANVNMRTSASKSARSVRVIPKGEEVTVVSKQGDWYIVDYDHDSGAVFGQYLTSASNAKKEGDKMHTTTAVNMRTSASTSARSIRVIPKGAEVTVVSKQGGWYIVDYDHDSGAVYGKYLK